MHAVDTGILLRLWDRNDPQHLVIRQALRLLRTRGEVLAFAPQNAAEFWNVSTRPVTARGGFGLSAQETERRLRLIERVFQLLPDSPASYPVWRRLVVQHGVQGVQVHDARLVAWMQVHGLGRILTLNPQDFSRYAGITAVTPEDVVTSLNTP